MALTVEVKALSGDLRQEDKLKRNRQTQQQRLAQAEARLEEIDAAIAAWEAEGAPRLAALRDQLADAAALHAQEEKVAELAEIVAAKETLSRAKQEAQRTHSQAEARLGEIERLLEEWRSEGQAEQAEVERRLAEQDYAADAQAKLAELEEKLAELDYDAAAHQAARAARDELADAPARYQKLQEARAAVKPLEDTLTQLESQIADQKETVKELTEQHDTAVTQLEALTADAGDLHAVEDEVFELREQVNARQRAVGAAQQKLDVLEDLRTRRVRLKQERAELSRRVGRLKRLEKACGRDGVQALLIEHALPDIEASANDLLERLTGGGMRVSFETQRQLKSRDATVETLDIHIQDGAGERPYENFSGGEQFRVNFAIRLALSQILAKRAGARLQTLVIDEGFGSQDPVGRQRLVEAINTIQDDFARILVITHIAELRDAFPARIQVEKDAHGSHIEIL
jgi:exonuclease SbcC